MVWVPAFFLGFGRDRLGGGSLRNGDASVTKGRSRDVVDGFRGRGDPVVSTRNLESTMGTEAAATTHGWSWFHYDQRHIATLLLEPGAGAAWVGLFDIRGGTHSALQPSPWLWLRKRAPVQAGTVTEAAANGHEQTRIPRQPSSTKPEHWSRFVVALCGATAVRAQ